MAVKTYQDLLDVGERDDKRIKFVKDAIVAHKSSPFYKTAELAHLYDMQMNPTIVNYQKLLYKVSGEAVPDNYSANFKLRSNLFHRLITELIQYELGNGTKWMRPSRPVSEATASKYPADEVYEEDVWNPNAEMYVPQWFVAGTDRKVGEDFDARLSELFTYALSEGVSFGFWNYDHLEVFSVREFVPFYDEENGALMAGIRFWQIDPNKPLRATLYEVDGYTDYMWDKKHPAGLVKEKKRKYKTVITSTEADVEDDYIYKGENYEGFPIIPAWASRSKMSALEGMRENLDAYDLIKSQLCNTVSEASLIYWTLNNASGMDEIDLAKFQDQMNRLKMALVEDGGASAEAHSMDVPYQGTEATLERIRNDIYEDFMCLDTKTIASGATTATQIQASYEPQNNRADELENGILDFIQRMLQIAGIQDKPTFVRSVVVNKAEEIQILMQSAQFLPEEYLTKRILTIFGDIDAYDEVMRMKMGDEMDMAGLGGDDEDEEEETQETAQEAPEGTSEAE